MIDPKIDDQGYCLPPEMSNILTATISETSQGDVILCHDNAFIYAAKVIKGGGNVTFQKFSLPLVSSISSIIKNYFMALFDSKRLIIFEVGFNQQGKIVLKFIFNKDRPISTYFIREVTDNMAELQIFFPDNQIIIYQFTVNGKIGVMNYGIAAQNKIRLCQRQQLYGSKTMFCYHRKSILYFTNFSNKFVSVFNLNKFESEIGAQHGAFPIAYVSRLQEFYVLLSNYYVINVLNSTSQHKVYCEEGQAKLIQQLIDPRETERYRQKGEKGLKITTYFDLVLIEDIQRSIAYIFQIKQKGSALIGVQYGKMNWFWTGSRKLVGLSLNRNRFKIIDQIKINQKEQVENPFLASLNPTNARKDFKLKEGLKNPNEGKQKTNIKSMNKEEESQKGTPIKTSRLQGEKGNNPNTSQKQENSSQTAQLPKINFPQQRLKQFAQIPGMMMPPFGTIGIPEGLIPPPGVARQGFPLGMMLPPPPNYTIPIFPPRSLPEKAGQVAQKFKPNKIIQKNKVSVSKTVSKSKEIEPISKQQGENSNETSEGVKQNEPIAQQQKNEDKLTQQISQQCEKMANSFLQKEEKAQQPEKVQEKQQQKAVVESSSQEQVQIKEQGDVYPKEQSSKSQSIVVPQQKQKQDEAAQIVEGEQDNNLDQQKKQEKQEKQEKQAKQDKQDKQDKQEKDESLPKSLALVIGKSNLGGEYSHPLNLFNTSINRNNIFSSIQPAQKNPNQNIQQLRRYHSEQQYYNPFKSLSPCISPQKQQKEQQKVKQEPDEEQVDLIKTVKQLFTNTTTQLLKVVDQVANLKQTQPYLKAQIVDQMKKNIKEAMQKVMIGQFTSRIQRYFYQIFRQTDQVQQQSIKFYKEANNHRTNNIQVQLNNQEKIIKEVRQIENNLRFSIAHLKDSNRTNFEVFLRQWAQNAQQAKKMVQDLQVTRSKIEVQQQERGKRYEQTKSKLQAIKILLSQRINAQSQRKQRKLDKQKLKQAQKEEKGKKKKRVEKKVKKSSGMN